MDDEQRKAIEELIRVVRVTSYTLRGIWFHTKRGSSYEAALEDIQSRLEAAAEAALNTLAQKSADPVMGELVH